MNVKFVIILKRFMDRTGKTITTKNTKDVRTVDVELIIIDAT